MPGTVCEMRSADLAQESARGVGVGSGDGRPEIELRVASADDGFECGFFERDGGVDRAGDDAEVAAQFAPVGGAVVLAEHGKFAGGGRQESGERLEKGGLAAAVGAEDGPVFAVAHAPLDVVQDRGAIPGDAEAGDFEDGRGRFQGP